MREYTTPALPQPLTDATLTERLFHHAHHRADDTALVYRSAETSHAMSWAEFAAKVTAVAKGFIAAGIGHGDTVGLWSATRYEWTICDYALWHIGAITVPIHDTATRTQMAHIVADSQLQAIVVDTAEAVSELEKLPHRPGKMWVLAQDGLAQLERAGADVPSERLVARHGAVSQADLATIIYTSGTTGTPKGCMLSHANLLHELQLATAALPELFSAADAATLLFLPLSHVMARIVQVGSIQAGIKLGFGQDITRLDEDLAWFQPSFILGVPRIFERIFNTASLLAEASGQGRAFNRAVTTAIAYSRSLDVGRTPFRLKARHRYYDQRFYHGLRSVLGGRCRFAISGGAPLGDRLGHFFRGIGVTILEGYGSTETTAAVTVNRPGEQKIGSVGRPLPGTTIRIAATGEVLVRGPQVFQGYFGDEAATRELLSPDGWLHTGDIGEIDAEGFLTITGRAQELMITASGKHIAPTTLEDQLRSYPLVDQCLVVGDQRPFVVALITLDTDMLLQWAQHHGHKPHVSSLRRHPQVYAEIDAAVAEVNANVSQAESIRKFLILPDVWTEEAGQLTPSLKVKRAVLMRQYVDEIETLYTHQVPFN